MDLRGKVAVITGAANKEGIGYATAKKFLEYGIEHVVIIDVDPAIGATAASLGDKVTYHHADVSDEVSMEIIVHDIVKKHKKIDILFNNAGINIPSFTHECTMSSWEKHMRVNVTSQFIMNKLTIPIMRKQGSGSIIHTSSINAICVESGNTAYSVSKAAIMQLAKSDAIDNAEYGIRVNSIAPGLVHTGFNDLYHDMYDGGREEVEKNIKDINPTGRAVAVESIANMALYLASDLSVDCIGHCFVVDGGLSAR